MAKKICTERKMIRMAEVELDVDELFDGKGIRAVQDDLEKFRIKLNEYEILYGATITMETGWDSVRAVVRRPETDREYNDRMIRNQIARERKATAAQRKLEQEALKVKKKEEQQRKKDLNELKRIAKTYKLDFDITVLEQTVVDKVVG